MFLKNKFYVASLLIASTALLSGCAFDSDRYNTAVPNKPAASSSTATQQATAEQQAAQVKANQVDSSYPESQKVLNSAMNRPPVESTTYNADGTEQQSFAHLNTCVKELNALKTLSPKDYNRLVGSFKEVSEINRLYRQVETTASPDTIELLQMAIESKTKVLCAKVRYNSVLSTESTLKKISGL
ncbi:MAG TPA: hypothetical protein DD649_01700 [Providencia sp.]|uniref:hypothetical protein n=1 Tax=unclassified Providencia TaxID=2633465 RepID=UPI000E9A0A12|nr:hypothetical protein [Providencia sp.]HBO21592.1 hypothetical protein [Providencia sp.]